jgi:hypothetical protein
VRALPYEWWDAKSIEFKVKRDDGRGYIFPSSPEKNTERPYVAQEKKESISIKAYKKARAVASLKEDHEREEGGGLRGWLK